MLAAERDNELKIMLSCFEEDTGSNLSLLRELGFLQPKGSEGHRLKIDLIEMLSSESMKHVVAQAYLEGIMPEEKSLDWSGKIHEFLR